MILYRMPWGEKSSAARFTYSLVENWPMVAGKSNNEEAKMGGITPAVFRRRGRCEFCPPNIFRPT